MLGNKGVIETDLVLDLVPPFRWGLGGQRR
jgi:hypothetical protein